MFRTSTMLRIFIFSLFGAILAPVLAVQVPLGSGAWREEEKGVLDEKDRIEWDLNKPPHTNDTDHLVFETVYSLLQHWPNTRMRNGHNLVPGIIPKGTLLYRGSNDDQVPAGADWVAADPEHAYVFCKDTPPPNTLTNVTPQGCWHLTMVTTRALKIVYFDGSSAAKLPYGSMDTQDLLAWGETSFDSVYGDRSRIEELCKWAKKFDVDGFVRMEPDFEAMLCDFTSGVRVASLANLVNWRTMPSMSPSVWFESINSGSWHNHFPGEPRVQLDLAGLVSFYDTKLVPSLIPIRFGQERWDHRVGNVSSEDLAAVKERLETILARPAGLSSGFDWRALFAITVDRFSERLELIRHLLDTSTDDILDVANKTHTQLRIMLTPYILASVTPTDAPDETGLEWTMPVYKFCATIHTQFIESEVDSLTDSEKLLLQALRGTNREICRVVTRMWAAGVYAGIDPSLHTQDALDMVKLSQVLGKWAEDLNRLMTWLDWSVWIKCHPECGPEEMCYLPTWPFGFPLRFVRSRQPSAPHRPLHLEDATGFGGWAMESPGEGDTEELDDWTRPQPRCVGRVAPYDRFVSIFGSP